MKIKELPESRSGHVFLLIFVLLSSAALAAGWWYYQRHDREFRARVESELSSIAELKVNGLLQYRRERLGDAGILFGNASFSGLVSRFLENPSDSISNLQLSQWIGKYRNHYQYDRVYLLDTLGLEERVFFLKNQELERYTAPSGSALLTQVLREGFHEVLRTSRVSFLDFYRNEFDGRPYLMVLVPILKDGIGSPVIAVLALRIDPETFLYPYLQLWPVPSRTGETILIRREGDSALFLNELRFHKDSALKLKVPLVERDTTAGPPVIKAALGLEGIFEGLDYRREPVLSCVHRVPDSPWYVEIKMDKSELFGRERRFLWQLVVMISLIMFGSAASAGFFWRRQQMHYYRERYETVEVLRRLSARYEALLAAVPDIITEVDNSKVITWTNAPGLEFFGADVIGREAKHYFEGEQDTYRIVKPLFDGTDDIIRLESWQRRRDGQKRLLAWWCRPLKDSEGNVTGALSTARDITEQRKAEQALLESESRFRVLFENMTEGVALHEMVYDAEGLPADYRILTVNPAYYRHTGIRQGEIEGRLAGEFYATGSPPFLEKYESVARTGEPCSFETYFAPLDKHFRISVISPRSGCFATVFDDITGILRREQELKEKNDELIRFTYTVSHDLKSPLVTIKTFLGYLEKDLTAGDGSALNKDLSYIRSAADKMSRLLDELLELSRVGRKMNPTEDLTLQELVQEAMDLVAGRIAARGVAVEVTSEPVTLNGDRPRLVEVFQNLLDNAVKFMGDQPSPRIDVGVERDDGRIVIFVRDNGGGIDPRHKSKLFGLFEKLDPATEGSGIGLALVKRIVEVHGGSIWVESEGRGKGAAFKFTLPKTSVRMESGEENA